MANYIGKERTNYFRVKDEDAFKKWAEELGLEVATETNQKGENLFALFPSRDSEDGGFPTVREDQGETEDWPESIDLLNELSAFLQPGSVAILMGIGSEKMRYLHGYAEAINSEGERASITLDDIYKLAVKLGAGEKVTLAEY